MGRSLIWRRLWSCRPIVRMYVERSVEDLCLGQCDQANCRMKLGMLGLSSSCLWRLEGGNQLDIFLAWALLEEERWIGMFIPAYKAIA